MATNKPQDDYQKQGVRIPKALHARLHEAASVSGRSYNSELIARLEASFVQAEGAGGNAEMADAIAKMQADQAEILLALRRWQELDKAITEGRATAVPKGVMRIPKRKPAE